MTDVGEIDSGNFADLPKTVLRFEDQPGRGAYACLQVFGVMVAQSKNRIGISSEVAARQLASQIQILAERFSRMAVLGQILK